MDNEKLLFANACDKAREWINELASQMDCDTSAAYSAFRSVMHVLRDRLGPAANAQLASELPLLLRGVYYEGYRPACGPTHLHTSDEFLKEVGDRFQGCSELGLREITETVFAHLETRISEGQVAHIRQMLPKNLRDLWPAIQNNFARL